MDDDELVKQKEQIAKLRGASNAMTSALKRIEALENQLRKDADLFDEMARAFGDGLHVTSYRQLPHADHSGERRMVNFSDLMKAAAAGVRRVL
ncbi:MAG: hypothetical protein AAFR68_08265 [Pseudomonadota bacterium]